MFILIFFHIKTNKSQRNFYNPTSLELTSQSFSAAASSLACFDELDNLQSLKKENN